MRLDFPGFRRLFYAVTPNETTFPSVQETPDYIRLATPWFPLRFLLNSQHSTLDTTGPCLEDNNDRQSRAVACRCWQ